MSDMNIVAFTGRLTRDPELRALPSSGKSVCNFSVAVNERWGKDSERVHYVDCTAWEVLAETVARNLKKGRKVGVAGKFNFQKWERDGVTKTKLGVTAMQVSFLDYRPDDGEHYDEGAPL